MYKKENIVYVDESGIDCHLHRRNARSAKEKKVFGFVAGKKFQRTNIAAGYVDGKTIAECVYDCTTDDEVFNAWLEQFLVAALKPGQVVLMGNATFHKHRRTRKAIEATGCSLIYLPPYSPDLNPIEKFWANPKGTLSHILHPFPLSSTLFSMLFWSGMTTYFPDLNPIEKFWANLKGTLSHILHLFPFLSDAIHYAFLE
ncbi:MAG: transposase [Puniceicoccales bacterium]|nr:transposase [Puniceicoccales bacterium]